MQRGAPCRRRRCRLRGSCSTRRCCRRTAPHRSGSRGGRIGWLAGRACHPKPPTRPCLAGSPSCLRDEKSQHTPGGRGAVRLKSGWPLQGNAAGWPDGAMITPITLGEGAVPDLNRQNHRGAPQGPAESRGRAGGRRSQLEAAVGLQLEAAGGGSGQSRGARTTFPSGPRLRFETSRCSRSKAGPGRCSSSPRQPNHSAVQRTAAAPSLAEHPPPPRWRRWCLLLAAMAAALSGGGGGGGGGAAALSGGGSAAAGADAAAGPEGTLTDLRILCPEVNVVLHSSPVPVRLIPPDKRGGRSP